MNTECYECRFFVGYLQWFCAIFEADTVNGAALIHTHALKAQWVGFNKKTMCRLIRK